jgi:hypothetical protein
MVLFQLFIVAWKRWPKWCRDPKPEPANIAKWHREVGIQVAMKFWSKVCPLVAGA